MKKRLLAAAALLFSVVASFCSRAQPVAGALAADWTFKDISNVSHHLYDYLDSGYLVIIDVSATWCAPCWAFHNTHVGDSLTRHYGPNGTIAPKKIKFFLIEGDRLTGSADLYGNTSASQGNWVAGTNYTIIDTSGLNIPYHITGYPTFIAICPNKRVAFASAGGANPESFWVGLMNNCPAPSSAKDAALLLPEDTANICRNPVMIQNLWSQPLTAATVEVYDGNTRLANLPWTGNLRPFGIAGVNFPAGTPPVGQGQLHFKLAVTGDADPANDSASSAYDIAALSGNRIRIEVKTDRYPYEDSWKLLDGNSVIGGKEYGLYDTGRVFTYDYTVNTGTCLRFELHDSYGDGISGGTTFTTLDDGYVKIFDGINNSLLASMPGNSFAGQTVRHYRASGTPSLVREAVAAARLVLYPNPADEALTLDLAAAKSTGGQLTIADMTGQIIYVQDAAAQGAHLQMSILTRNWPSGFYILRLRCGAEQIIRKLQVMH